MCLPNCMDIEFIWGQNGQDGNCMAGACTVSLVPRAYYKAIADPTYLLLVSEVMFSPQLKVVYFCPSSQLVYASFHPHSHTQNLVLHFVLFNYHLSISLVMSTSSYVLAKPCSIVAGSAVRQMIWSMCRTCKTVKCPVQSSSVYPPVIMPGELVVRVQVWDLVTLV